MYDLMQWMRNPNWQKSHLIGFNTNPLTGKQSPVIQHCFDSGKTIAFAKTNTGNPLDLKPYDNSFIYDGATELSGAAIDWQTASNYKQNGWPMLPRFWNGDPTWYMYHPSAPWKGFQNCKQTSSGDVGPVTYNLTGPYLQDYGGDLGVLETILANYFWGKGMNREQLFLTNPLDAAGKVGAGWPMWTHASLQPDGLYLVDSISLHNKIVAVTVKPNFPCYVI